MKCGHCKRQHETVAEVRFCAHLHVTAIPPPGRYAVRISREPGAKLRFFIATHKNFYEQAGPRRFKLSANTSYVNMAIKAILKNPREAMAMYGKELGLCGRCGLELTKEISRQRGFGPECWDKLQ